LSEDIGEVADAISSLLQASPHQKLHVEQIEHGLSPGARVHMREALNLLLDEGTIDGLDDIYYALR
jgi:hypothetical protein